MSESAWSGYPPIEQRDAEIARLKAEIERRDEGIAQQVLAQKIEIERLRGELAECERVGGKFMEEIERLREVMRRVANELGRENEGLVQMIRDALGE